MIDICIYGGTAAGVMAAVAARKKGRSVLLIEPGRHLGGMSSGGLGATDFGNKAAIGGMSREFYRRLGRHYGEEEAWKFEPGAAERIFHELVAEHKVAVLFGHHLAHVDQRDGKIAGITLENVPTDSANAPVASPLGAPRCEVEAAMYIDAGYEGDLMAAAGVSYAVGRESAREYDESLNGIRGETPLHQFRVPVDPYVRPGDPSSGLLPLIQSGDGGVCGEGDHRVQAYNFRLCFTQNPANRLPILPPAGYDAARYELLARYLQNLVDARVEMVIRRMLWSLQVMPNGKTDINNNGAVSTDFIGESDAYPDGDYATRGRIWHEHLRYTQGLLHFLITDPRVPSEVQREISTWGPCRDEFTDTNHWPHQIYVREARRMRGSYVVTQADCEHRRTVADSIGLGAYTMDSHNCQRIVQNGVVRNEGDVQVKPTGPYPISYRALTPPEAECRNLLVPVCFSATHIAYGSARMEPVFMVLGESAGVAAASAVEQRCAVQAIDLQRLTEELREAGQVLGLT